MNKISSRFDTNRLVIEKALITDQVKLQTIAESWKDKNYLEGEDFPKDYIISCLRDGDLPPSKDASIENYFLYKIILKESSEIIGFFDLYHGYPKKDTLWISMFIIDNEKQKYGYGQEVINEFFKICQELNWIKVGIAVHLKNWKALRFWTKLGFNNVLGIFGDKEYSENSFAIIGLEKIL